MCAIDRPGAMPIAKSNSFASSHSYSNKIVQTGRITTGLWSFSNSAFDLYKKTDGLICKRSALLAAVGYVELGAIQGRSLSVLYRKRRAEKSMTAPSTRRRHRRNPLSCRSSIYRKYTKKKRKYCFLGETPPVQITTPASERERERAVPALLIATDSFYTRPNLFY